MKRIVTWTDPDTGDVASSDALDLEDAAFQADYYRDVYGARNVTVTDPDDIA